MGSVYKQRRKDPLNKGQYIEKSKFWWIKYYSNGKIIRESSGTESEKEALKLMHIHEGDAARGVPIIPRVGKMKFSELAEDEINDYMANALRSLRDLKIRFKNHVLPFFGEIRASTINTSDIRKYVTQRQGEGASNGQINRELAAIKRAFSLGVQAGKILSRPHIPMLKESNVRSGFFELDQFLAVRKNLSDDLRPVVSCAYLTGWRIYSEVLPLKWPQVDFQAGLVRLEPGTTKNDEARVFPLTDELRAVLEEQKAKADDLKKQGTICPWVFHRNGKPIKEFRRSWKSACKAAGVAGRILHDFRRSAVRNLVRAGIPEGVAMKMTGHKTRSVFERYNIVSEGDLFDAARKLNLTGRFTGIPDDLAQNGQVTASTQTVINQSFA